MIKLYIDSSHQLASVTLEDSTQGKFWTKTSLGFKNHGRYLMPLVRECLEMAKIKPAEVSNVIACAGPGSFTGVRVAIATALGFAKGVGARVYGIPVYAVLSYNYLVNSQMELPDVYAVLQSAGRGQYYISVVAAPTGGAAGADVASRTGGAAGADVASRTGGALTRQVDTCFGGIADVLSFAKEAKSQLIIAEQDTADQIWGEIFLDGLNIFHADRSTEIPFKWAKDFLIDPAALYFKKSQAAEALDAKA